MKTLRAIVFAGAWLCLAVAPGSAQNSQGGTRIIALPGGGGSSSLVIGTTPVTGGTSGQCLYINSGTIGAQSCGINQGVTPIVNGTDKQVLFDDGGVVNGDAGLIYTKATGTLAPTILQPTTRIVSADTRGTSNSYYISAGGYSAKQTAAFQWTGGTDATAAATTSLWQASSGVMEISNATTANALGSLLLTNITASGSITATGLPTSTPGGTPSTVCWDATAQTFWTDATATGPCGIVSALRFKNLIDVDSQLNPAGLATLRTGPWQFKPDSPYAWDTKIHVGLIADQVAAMDRRCGVYDEHGVKNYEDRCLIAYLVAAINDLRARFEDYKVTRHEVDGLK